MDENSERYLEVGSDTKLQTGESVKGIGLPKNPET